MSWKQGDKVRHVSSKEEYVLYADQVGDFVWAAKKKYADSSDPCPTTHHADRFEEIPVTPQKDQIWESSIAFARYRILVVCGDMVVFEALGAEDNELKYARRAASFTRKYKLVHS